jgi:hypothetical protein
MAIAERFMSSTDVIFRYLAERARPVVLVPLAAVLAIAGWLVAPAAPWSTPQFLATTANAFIWVLAFRVWDDLEDRSRDAREHPNRVMVVDRRTSPFVGLALMLATAGSAVVAFSVDVRPRIVVLGAAVIVLAAWYRLRGERSPGVIGGHVVLIKYPALALALAPSLPSFGARAAVRASAILAVVYLGLCVYESFDDPQLRASRTARGIAITELVLLVPLIVGTLTSFTAGTP